MEVTNAKKLRKHKTNHKIRTPNRPKEDLGMKDESSVQSAAESAKSEIGIEDFFKHF